MNKSNVTYRSDAAAGVASGPRPLIFHVTNIPTPYRLPYYRAVCAALRNEGIDFHVFFLGRGKRRREWKITDDDLRGFPFTMNDADPSRTYREVVRSIEKMKPSVVVLAWAMDPLALRLLFYCRRRKIPCILFTGETIATAVGRSHAWLRTLVRAPFFRLASRFLTYGTRATEYLRSQGVPSGKITTGINVVDTDFFRERVDKLRRSGEAEAERERYRDTEGMPFRAHLLLVNYMIPGKGISSTLRALRHLDRSDLALHIVGSGPREEAHRSMVASLGLEGQVFFHGYRQTAELPIYYAMADIFLFPSFVDVFGLVMVEAAAAALPLIASLHSGGTIDVVDNDVTGIVVDPRDTAAYASAIARLADDPELRERMGEAGRRKVSESLTPEESARRYLQAVGEVQNSKL